MVVVVVGKHEKIATKCSGRGQRMEKVHEKK